MNHFIFIHQVWELSLRRLVRHAMLISKGVIIHRCLIGLSRPKRVARVILLHIYELWHLCIPRELLGRFAGGLSGEDFGIVGVLELAQLTLGHLGAVGILLMELI